MSARWPAAVRVEGASAAVSEAAPLTTAPEDWRPERSASVESRSLRLRVESVSAAASRAGPASVANWV
ncbi:hypothetical protein MCHLDSM_00329 [Mycolicibacterium chlorophenolicum]|uniref:Uncharacterized protein n=1 Tax=Mycolicibacterium chlorophenolicum TaxID=37916 RepID=A0A0J6WPP6_9MYCO|nr:hypothetical protein MCHLDSM_00329 [Mycolicibacterium chlorophenolicum]